MTEADPGAPGSVALVVNPTAGKGRARALLPQVVGRLRHAGHQVETLLSRTPDEAAGLVDGAVRSGADVVAVMGGDGMLHLGVNAVAEHRQQHPTGPALGLLPAGTGNDLARGIGLDPHDTVAAADVIAGGRTRPLDLLRVSGRYVGTVVASGFDSLVNRRANAMTWPRGSGRYTFATLAELRTFSPLSYRLTIDGEPRELDAMLIAVGNTSSYGGGMRICPSADATDGWLDVTIIHPISRLKLLQLLPQMRSGRFARDACVEQLRARVVRIDGDGLLGYGDGEELGAAPMLVESCPAALNVCVPASSEAARAVA